MFMPELKMTEELFASEVGKFKWCGFSGEGIHALWKWYSETVKHAVVFNPEHVAYSWVEYENARDAVGDLNEGYIKGFIRKENGKRLTEMDMRTFSEDLLLVLLKKKMNCIVTDSSRILVDISD